MDSRPLRDSMHTNSFYYNRIAMIGLYITNATYKLQLQSYIDGRPSHGSMLHVNFNCNRIEMIGLYIMQCWQ